MHCLHTANIAINIVVTASATVSANITATDTTTKGLYSFRCNSYYCY